MQGNLRNTLPQSAAGRSLAEQARKDLLRLSTDAQRRAEFFLGERIGASKREMAGKQNLTAQKRPFCVKLLP